MARPRKDNAEYFSHDSGMRNDEKVIALRSKFNNEGYAIWCMLLEILTNEEHFRKEIKTDIQKELLAGDLRVSVAEIDAVLSFCIRINLLNTENDIYWSENLVKRLDPMVQKRENMRQKYESKVVSASETEVSTEETPQSKVKESKVKESKVKESKVNNLQSKDCVNDINLLMEIFAKFNPATNYGNKTQRKALEWLINLEGLENAKAMVEYAISIQGKQYTPTITTPIQFKNKFGDLKAYAEKQKSNNLTIAE